MTASKSVQDTDHSNMCPSKKWQTQKSRPSGKIFLGFLQQEKEFTLTRFSTSPQTERAVRGEGGGHGEGWEGKV